MSEVACWEKVLRKWDSTAELVVASIFDEYVLVLRATKDSTDLENFLTQCDVDVLNGRLMAWPIVYCGVIHRKHLRLV
jgi:hypothetical protein